MAWLGVCLVGAVAIGVSTHNATVINEQRGTEQERGLKLQSGFYWRDFVLDLARRRVRQSVDDEVGLPSRLRQ